MASQQQDQETSKSVESLDGDSAMSPECKEGKKGRFQLFKAMKNLISRKKSKDLSASDKSKSVSELHVSQVPGTSVGTGSLTPLGGTACSVSADSVFQKHKESDMPVKTKVITRSDEQINTEDLTELITSGTPSKAVHVGGADGSDEMLLNKPLNVSAAKDRIRVRNPKRRPSNKYRTAAAADPRTPLTKVAEKPKAEQSPPLVTENPQTTMETPEKVEAPKSVKILEPTKTLEAAKILEPAITPEPAKILEPAKTLKPGKILEPVDTAEPVADKDIEVVKLVDNSESKKFKVSFEEEEMKEARSNEHIDGVVFRKEKDGEEERTKCRTLSETNPTTESPSSLFGGQMKRASSFESKNWEVTGSSPQDSYARNETVSEFTAAFNKMQQKRREELESEDSSNVLSASKPVQKKISRDELSRSTSITYSASSVGKTIKTEIKKLNISQVVSVAVQSKEKVASDSKTEKKPAEVKNTDALREKETQSIVQPSHIKKLSTVESMRKEESTIIKPNVSSFKLSFQSNITTSDGDASAYKKATPTQKPKWRSKTLPEQPVCMKNLSSEKSEASSSDKSSLKRASSHKLGKPQLTVSAAGKTISELVRQHSTKPKPNKLEIGETGSGNRQEPEWMRLVRKRKQQEKEENAVDKGQKEEKKPANLSMKVSCENVQKSEIVDTRTAKEVIISYEKEEAHTTEKIKSSKTKEGTTTQRDESSNKAITIPGVNIRQKVFSENIPKLSMKKVEEVKLGSSPTSKIFERGVILDKGKPTPVSSTCSEVSSKKQTVRDMIKSYQNLQVS